MRNDWADQKERIANDASQSIFCPTVLCQQPLEAHLPHQPQYWHRCPQPDGSDEVALDGEFMPDEAVYHDEYLQEDLDILDHLRNPIKEWINQINVRRGQHNPSPLDPQWRPTGTLSDTPKCWQNRISSFSV